MLPGDPIGAGPMFLRKIWLRRAGTKSTTQHERQIQKDSHCHSSHAICAIMDTNAFFLGLPPAVRERIYCMIVPQSDFINDLNPQPDGSSIKVYRRVYNLMLTCRTMYFEVSPLLYSRNHIFIRYRDHGNLEALRNLQPGSMASIHRLTIHLNVSSCEQGDACCDLTLHVCDGEHDQPLGTSPSVSDSTI